MARDKLQVLLSLRRRSVEQARYALAACLAAESEAADRIRTLDDTVRRDRETGAGWQDAHQFVEMSVIRQDDTRADRGMMLADLMSAEAASARARGAISHARADVETVAHLSVERAAVCRDEALGREQHVLDDIARTRLAIRQRRERP